jgi:hypothetical protein
MAKSKEELNWQAINVDTLTPSLQAKHKAIRDLFDVLKVAKAEFETECDQLLVKIAAQLPADVKTTLRVTVDGKFPPNTVRKFSYMRGVAVATANAAKAKVSGGIALS